MPTNRRRKSLSRRFAGLSPREKFFLLHGHDFAWLDGEPFDSETEMRRAWREYRAELMAECKLFERPFAWWLFQSPSPRRLLKSHPDFQPLGEELSFGCPRLFWPGRLTPEPKTTWADLMPKWESERDYLERLGLLTREETAVLNTQISKGLNNDENSLSTL